MSHRCSAVLTPQRILGQISAVAAQQVEDEERFKKTQVTDQTNFDDQLDTLKVSSAYVIVFFFFNPKAHLEAHSDE